jgi:hypothetical protein
MLVPPQAAGVTLWFQAAEVGHVTNVMPANIP